MFPGPSGIRIGHGAVVKVSFTVKSLPFRDWKEVCIQRAAVRRSCRRESTLYLRTLNIQVCAGTGSY